MDRPIERRLGAARRTLFATFFLVCVVAATTHASEAAFREGEQLTGFTLETQFGQPVAVDAKTRILLFSRDMEGGDLLKQALEDVPGETLEERGAVYVSDISGMPSLVAKLFAVPAMRRRPYEMLLDREGSTTSSLPDNPGQATLIHLDALRIERIEHASSVEAIRSSLGLEPEVP
jgi:hypothetical protein